MLSSVLPSSCGRFAVGGRGGSVARFAGPRRSVPRRASAAAAAARAGPPTVLLTREEGKNDKMLSGLRKHGLACVELPLIEHTMGADRDKLPAALSAGEFDWVAITSPEAATVFLEAWHQAGQPKVRIAVVGAGTGQVLLAAGVTPDYTPSKATGVVLGAELPHIPGGSDVVLYPSSAKASSDLQNSLTKSGFSVLRLNTYNTSGVKPGAVPPEVLARALAADVITFGSPSAVKAWVALVGLEAASARLSVCIGSTSARACDAVGLPSARVYYPDSPGVPEWVGCVLRACEENGLVVESAPVVG